MSLPKRFIVPPAFARYAFNPPPLPESQMACLIWRSTTKSAWPMAALIPWKMLSPCAPTAIGQLITGSELLQENYLNHSTSLDDRNSTHGTKHIICAARINRPSFH
ncbi:putative hNH endonuclease [Pseudomonas fluorescens]|uniref:Putative hNH endonuclease n=1 Tax=Pseudomonas fluorescens TaxID=294 RepID=A0A0P8XN59_PSEFL|nr:putative hNH endonuclease [Pseudomonas fluorescens]